jgi:hypothetical protein
MINQNQNLRSIEIIKNHCSDLTKVRALNNHHVDFDFATKLFIASMDNLENELQV